VDKPQEDRIFFKKELGSAVGHSWLADAASLIAKLRKSSQGP
jgi:hypothetical protein